jgi:hypothetical protein
MQNHCKTLFAIVAKNVKAWDCVIFCAIISKLMGSRFADFEISSETLSKSAKVIRFGSKIPQ